MLINWDARFVFFFFNDTATTEIYTLSLHDALPILQFSSGCPYRCEFCDTPELYGRKDRKSTRLNSSHQANSYAVFCLKKKKGRAVGDNHGGRFMVVEMSSVSFLAL